MLFYVLYSVNGFGFFLKCTAAIFFPTVDYTSAKYKRRLPKSVRRTTKTPNGCRRSYEVCRRSPKFTRSLPKASEDHPMTYEDSQRFPPKLLEYFRRLPKISEEHLNFSEDHPKTYEDFPTLSEGRFASEFFRRAKAPLSN